MAVTLTQLLAPPIACAVKKRVWRGDAALSASLALKLRKTLSYGERCISPRALA